MQSLDIIAIGAILFILVVLLPTLLSSVRIVKEYERVIVFRLGRSLGARGPGIVFIIPVLEKGVLIDVRTKTLDIPKQEVMTSDNVPVSTNAICYYKVIDPMRAVVVVQTYNQAIYQLAQAVTRTVIGESELDEVLSKRDKLNLRIKAIITGIVDNWGLQIEAVEIKDVELPESMKRSMAQQAEAERDKRGRIIQAEGEKIAAEKLAAASKLLSGNPEGLHLRTLQALAEIGAEKNNTTIIMTPVEILRAFDAVPQLKVLVESLGK